MYGIGAPEIIIIFVVLVFILIPLIFVSKILNKAGFSGWFSLLSIVPLVNLIFLWVFAFIDWPNIDRQ
jgi:hypothetical protein